MSRFRDDDPGDPGGPGSPVADIVWIDINWAYVEPAPTGFLTGFEVVAYTGTNPADGNSYLFAPQFVPAADRRMVKSFALISNTSLPTVNGAVRAVYPFGKSAWAQTGASVASVGTGTQTYAADNLIPNPTSEMGTTAQGYAAAALVSDAVNSYAGTWCRRIDASIVGGDIVLTPLISCVYGDQFSFSAYVKSTSATPLPRLLLYFFGSTGTLLGTSVTIGTGVAATYRQLVVHGAVPAGAVAMYAAISNHSGATAGAFHYYDNLSLRRSVNYLNMATDEGFRAANAIGNTGTTMSDRVYYRGNNDPSTLGGAPAIATLTVTPQTWDTTNKQIMAELKLQPTAASSNLDGMRYAKVVLYRQSVAGTTATLTALKTYYIPLKDRLYNNSTDSNAANASMNIMANFDAGITSGVPAMLVTIYNAVGPSDTNCYYSAAGWTAGTALTNNGTSFPAGLTGGSSGGTGGGSGGGGLCPAPWTLIDMEDGTQKRADELQVGDVLKTIHAGTGTFGCWPVKAVKLGGENERWDVWVQGNPEPYTWSASHRIMTKDGWKEVCVLEPGDIWTGYVEATIERTQLRDVGPVVRLTIDQAGAYCTDGLLSSNIKFDPS